MRMTGPQNTENRKSDMSTSAGRQGALKKLLLYMKPWWGQLGLVMLLSLAASFLNACAPGRMKLIVDDIQASLSGPLDQESIRRHTLVTIILIGSALLCGLIQSMIAPVISQHTSRKLRYDINEKTNRLPLSYMDSTPQGQLLSIVINDVDNISTSFGNTLPSLLTAATTLTGCVVLMFLTNGLLALITIAVSCLGLFLNGVIMKKGMTAARAKQDSLGVVNSKVSEAFRGHLVIKAFGAEKDVMDSFHESNEQLRRSTLQSQFMTGMTMPVSNFAGNLGYIVVCVVGAALAFRGSIMVGTIVAFISYAQLFSNNLSNLAQGAGTIQPAIASAGRIFEFLSLPEMEDKGTEKPEKVTGQVAFEHVRFGYDPGKIIVKDFSLPVRPGQKVAIVGPTGAGKSTLVNLLERFYELNGGKISIDGVSISDMSRKTLHSMISMVLQETWTFEGSVRDNIVYAKEGVTDAQLQDVCEQTGLTAIIKNLPDGLDTVLKEDSGISAGQKQLITIARAMMDDSPILILDEATSSVDPRTEKIISAAIDHLMKGRTSFVIAHRLSTIQNADVILVLKDGDIIETGTHDELMKKNGFYADLYNSQFAS